MGMNAKLNGGVRTFAWGLQDRSRMKQSRVKVCLKYGKQLLLPQCEYES